MTIAPAASPDQIPITFDTVPVIGVPEGSYTSLQFGPDDRLYAADRYGDIRAFTIGRNIDSSTGAVTSFTVEAVETISAIADIPNHDDDGALNSSVLGRQVTGIYAAGSASQPVIYVSSSDPRTGGFGQPPTHLDTNSGIISRLSWNGSSWDKLDLVRGLPRSDADHSTNGLALGVDPLSGHEVLYAAQGANTDAGAPSADFDYLNEYALSSAILSIDLSRLQDPTLFPVHGSGANRYVYDIPTVQSSSLPFGGLQGLNQARLVAGGPVQVYASGFRNPYDIVITADGRMFSIDNGANAGTGGLPQGVGSSHVTNEIPTDDPNGINTVVNYDHLELVVPGSYAGHPNPTRANPHAGVLYTSPSGHSWVAEPGGAWPPVDSSFNFANNSAYLAPGIKDKAVALFDHSTDGLAEYRSATFDGALEGNLIAASLDGNIYRIQVSDDNSSAVRSVLASGFNGTPLDVTSQADTDLFPGTIWIAFVAGPTHIAALVPRLAAVPAALHVVSVTASGDGITAGEGHLTLGSAVTLTLALSEAVSVSNGIPTLLLNNGGVASYTAGSGSTALQFTYTVGAGQDTPDLAVAAVHLNGATVGGAINSIIVPGSGQSLIDPTGHVFTFGSAYQGGDYIILRDGATDGIGVKLALVNGVVFDDTASFGWYADANGHFVYQPTAPPLDNGIAADLSAAVTNPAGILQIDTALPPPHMASAPTVVSVTASGDGITAGEGHLTLGSAVTLTLALSEAVSVSNGIPTLLLNNGGVASYTAGSGSTALQFTYTVGAGQDTPDLAVAAVHLNGATVGGAINSIIVPGSGQSLIDPTGHVFTFGSAYQGGDYIILRDGDTDGIGVKLALVNGVVFDDTASFGWYADTNGHFVYQPTAPPLDNGIAADLSAAVTNPAGILQIDTALPPPHMASAATVVSVTASGDGITAGEGHLTLGSAVTLTLALSEAVSVSNGIPTLLLNNGGVASYTAGSGSAALQFTYTVGAGQDTPDLAVAAVHLNGATVGGAINSIIVPGSGQSLVDPTGHVFTFGSAYQGGDYIILRDGATDGIGVKLALVNGVVFDDTASFGWYADTNGHFVYQPTAPPLDNGIAADLSAAVTNPAGILQIDHTPLIGA